MDSSKVIKFLNTETKLDFWHTALLNNQNPNDSLGFNFKMVEETLPVNDVQASGIFYDKLCVFLSFIPGQQKWYAWDGRIHVPCTDDTVVRGLIEIFYNQLETAKNTVDNVIIDTIRSLTQSGVAEDDPKVKNLNKVKGTFKKAEAYIDRIGNSAGIESLLKALKTKLAVADDHFDNDQRYLVLRNCVIDLDIIRNNEGTLDKPGTILLHTPSRPVTRYLNVDFDPTLDYVDSAWAEFLRTSIEDNDTDTAKYLQKVTGAAFMGEHGLRTMINIVGPPGSGKSLFTGTFDKMGRYGSGYSISPGSSALVKVQGQNFEQDFFKHKRFIMISEPPLGEAIDDDFLKKFTGDASVTSRTLNVASTSWVPQGTLFIASNDTLRINSRDRAIVERMQVIKFPYRFVPNPTEPGEKKINNNLEGKFENDETEKSRILNWMLEGMSSFISGGRLLDPPDSIKKERAKVMSNGTSSLRWLNEVLESKTLIDITKTKVDFEINDAAYIPIDDAYIKYKFWCSDSGERTAPKRFFVSDVAHTFPEFSYGNKKLFKGLVLTNTNPPAPNNSGLSVMSSEMKF